MVGRGWVNREGKGGRGSARHTLGVVLLAACSATDVSSETRPGDWAARIRAVTLEPQVIEVGLGADPDGSRALGNFRLAAALQVTEPSGVAWLRRIALAHVLADGLARDASARGPVSDAELSSWSEAHWLGVDRPMAFRTTHAVVLSDQNASAADQTSARALAEQIRSAVLDAATVEEFRSKVAAVPATGLTVKVEDLDAVAADGRVVQLGAKVGAPIATYDEAFAKAAGALTQLGETSPVVNTSFGFHVLRLVGSIPELRFGPEYRREQSARDVYDLRARTQLNELITASRKIASAGIERSAEEATARVSVE